MTRHRRIKLLSGIPLLAASLLLATPNANAQQSATDMFSAQRVVATQQASPEIRDLVDKRLPTMERRLADMEQRINQLATAQPANIPPMSAGAPQAGSPILPPQQGGVPSASPQAVQPAPPPTSGEELLDELYGGEDEQEKIPSELQALLSFDPSEVKLDGATFVGCVNDQAMFRGADNKPFFVPATYALNHEAVRLIGGCSQ